MDRAARREETTQQAPASRTPRAAVDPSLAVVGPPHTACARCAGRSSDSWARRPHLRRRSTPTGRRFPDSAGVRTVQCFVTAVVPTHRCGAVPDFAPGSLLPRARLVRRCRTSCRNTICSGCPQHPAPHLGSACRPWPRMHRVARMQIVIAGASGFLGSHLTASTPRAGSRRHPAGTSPEAARRRVAVGPLRRPLDQARDRGCRRRGQRGRHPDRRQPALARSGRASCEESRVITTRGARRARSPPARRSRRSSPATASATTATTATEVVDRGVATAAATRCMTASDPGVAGRRRPGRSRPAPGSACCAPSPVMDRATRAAQAAAARVPARPRRPARRRPAATSR